ncbi:hypothetical protein AAE250_09505 [Bacteroides sp. GD17]|jgi:hypothetical protein|uniref:hypothetical protein n=1 Tax=Bacteroides sp. GD17 TaxID=3139826 RepID=UPI0025F3AB6C|nr:hypothetical protein [uncultured Bacteroides sp.]
MVIGIRPECRKKVIKTIIIGHYKNFFIEENPTSIKALAHWAYTSMVFIGHNGKPLSENTLTQEFGEVWREMKKDNVI